MLSAEGGVEIEAVAASNPDAIVKLHIDPVDGLDLATARQACIDAKLPERALDGAADILVKLYRCFTEGDCDPFEPGVTNIERRFTGRHEYRRAGRYTIRVNLSRAGKRVVSQTLSLDIRPGLGDPTGVY